MEEKLNERDSLLIDAEMYIGKHNNLLSTFSGRLFQTNGPLAAKLLSKCNLLITYDLTNIIVFIFSVYPLQC